MFPLGHQHDSFMTSGALGDVHVRDTQVHRLPYSHYDDDWEDMLY